jgi:hypothetical protein
MREEIKKARIKKKVLGQYPDAKEVPFSDGVRIMSGDMYIAEEFYMPSTNDTDTAWEYAAIACKTKQNFDRTHPYRMDLADIESKLIRINNRKVRGRRRAK